MESPDQGKESQREERQQPVLVGRLGEAARWYPLGQLFIPGAPAPTPTDIDKGKAGELTSHLLLIGNMMSYTF